MNETISQRAKAVLKTLAYFDIFDYPLTSFEIWKYLYAPGDSASSLEEIIAILNTPELKKHVSFAQGFYFLRGREEAVNIRKQRFLVAEPKIKKAKKFSRYLASLEGVLGIGISNTLAMQNSRPESDIDFFIITRSKQIWSTRFWSILPLYFFGGRPRGTDTRDKFCLSFLVDEKNLNLLPWKFENDIYYVYWLATLMPIFDAGIFEKFWQENKWIYQYLPNFVPPEPSPRLCVGSVVNLPITHNESFFRFVELKAMPNHLKNLAKNEKSEVVIKEGVLKFHPNDRRGEYQEKFNRQLNNFN